MLLEPDSSIWSIYLWISYQNVDPVQTPQLKNTHIDRENERHQHMTLHHCLLFIDTLLFYRKKYWFVTRKMKIIQFQFLFSIENESSILGRISWWKLVIIFHIHTNKHVIEFHTGWLFVPIVWKRNIYEKQLGRNLTEINSSRVSKGIKGYLNCYVVNYVNIDKWYF